jgi:hypothetical protein
MSIAALATSIAIGNENDCSTGDIHRMRSTVMCRGPLRLRLWHDVS